MGFFCRDVLCQLLETGWRCSAGGVLCQLLEAVWVLSAGGCTLSIILDSMAGCRLRCTLAVSSGKLAVVCKGVYTVSYLRKVGGCLQGVCNFLVI